MKQLIKKILKEETEFNILEKFVKRELDKKVKMGELPRIFHQSLKLLSLDKYVDEIQKIYFDYVGGPEEAFKMFKDFINNNIITEKDLKDVGINLPAEDKFKVKLLIDNPDYRGKRIVGRNDELEMGFSIIDGTFITSEGIMTLDELFEERYDDIWLDVTDDLRYQIEGYVEVVAASFFLEFSLVSTEFMD